jgi:hypothetical protein
MQTSPIISTVQYEKVIEYLLELDNSVPLLVISESGVGKTYIPQDIAKKKKIPCIVFNGTGLEPQDLVGMPWIDKTDTTRFRPPFTFSYVKDPASGELKNISEYPKGILILDEVNRLEYQCINTVMQLLDRKTLEEVSIPKGWAIVLTANPDDEEYQVRSLNKAFRRRCIILEMVSSLTDWRVWAMQNKIHEKIIAVAGRVESLRGVKEDGKGEKKIQSNAKQHITRAGMAQVSYLLNNGLDRLDHKLQSALIAGLIGPEGAAALMLGINDAELERAVKTLMVGGKIEGKADFLVEAALLFIMRIDGQEDKYAEEIYNLYKQAPKDIKPVIFKKFAHKALRAQDGPFFDMSKDWERWQVDMMTVTGR